MAVLSLLCFTFGIVSLGVAPIGAQGGSALFSVDPSVDTSQIPQCNDEGVSNCRAIRLNQEVLDGLSVSDTVDLLPSIPIGPLTLKHTAGSPSFRKSYYFTEGQWDDQDQ